MVRENILIVEDDNEILNIIKLLLVAEKYEVITATSGEKALNLLKSFLPDLIILDVMLPGLNGFEICEILKNNPETANIPTIFLTSQGAEKDILTGFGYGADDYVIKSSSHKILLARIKSVLHRKTLKYTEKSPIIRKHDILIDPNRYEVFINSERIELTYTEFKLLHFLALKPGWVYSRNQILEQIRGEDNIANDRSIDILITSLRKKLGEYGKCIETARGLGYSFKE